MVSGAASDFLRDDFGIVSIFDLGASILFDTARRIVDAPQTGNGLASEFIGADFLDLASRCKSASELADSSIAVLRLASDAAAVSLQDNLGISMIGEMGSAAAVPLARAIAHDAYRTVVLHRQRRSTPAVTTDASDVFHMLAGAGTAPARLVRSAAGRHSTSKTE